MRLMAREKKQRGSARRRAVESPRNLQVNRTEAFDASRRALRDGRVILPRRCRIAEEFVDHVAADAKQLHEDEETGAQGYTYVRSGPDHFTMAFTYDVIAWEREARASQPVVWCASDDEGGPWSPSGSSPGSWAGNAPPRAPGRGMGVGESARYGAWH